MKIGLSAFGHETITFWPGVTDLAAFERIAYHGQDVIDKNRGVNSCIGGFIDVLEPEGIEMIPICDAMGGATATVADEVYDFYVDKMTKGFAIVDDELDGILLAMHGAMVTENRQDPETDAVREIRQAVGDDIPIMVTFDLHGNKDKSILKRASAVFGYHSSPHVDMGQTGRRAARALIGMLEGNIKNETGDSVIFKAQTRLIQLSRKKIRSIGRKHSRNFLRF